MKQDKIWGTTECLTATPLVELHRIQVIPGGYCSIHQHQGRANGFYLVSGDLEVRAGTERLMSARDLRPGDYFAIQPGVTHQFFSSKGCEALELYYPVLRGEDIQRLTVGGIEA